MKTFKLCYDVLGSLPEAVDYTYKDGYYHTRLCLADAKSIISGFEDKLAFVTSLAIAHYLSINTVRADELNWDKIIENFIKSEGFADILSSISSVRITKGLKILKPYSKKKTIDCLELLKSYKPLLADNTSDNFYQTFHAIFGCELCDFLYYDDTEIYVTERTEVDVRKFKSKHKRINSLWD